MRFGGSCARRGKGGLFGHHPLCAGSVKRGTLSLMVSKSAGNKAEGKAEPRLFPLPSEQREELLSACRICPCNCGVNRLKGQLGVCGQGAALRVARAGLHFGEEPPLRGQGGSGTIFLSGCAMKCPFCQNYQISRGGLGRDLKEDDFVQLCLALQNAGAENLNLVTPSHMTVQLAETLRRVRSAGVNLPVAWNSSGYEKIQSLEIIAGEVDIWLPDLKTLSEDAAGRCYGRPDYPLYASQALLFMAGRGAVETDEEGRMLRGLMVRHLVLPGEMASTRNVLKWFAEHLAGKAWLSLMTQYTPVRIPGEKRGIPGRRLNLREYGKLLDMLEEYGIDDGFVQDLSSTGIGLPDFREVNPFGDDLFCPVQGAMVVPSNS